MAPALRAILDLSEDARLLYFSIRVEADSTGRVRNQVSTVQRLVLGDCSLGYAERLMEELYRAGLVRIVDGGRAIEVKGYREDDPKPDWAEGAMGGPPARKPALSVHGPATKPDRFKGV